MDSSRRLQETARLGHLLRSSSSVIDLSSGIKLHIRLLLTSSTGASPQAPMHSPSFSVNRPSGVVSLKPMPSFPGRCFAASLAPDSAHGRFGADGDLDSAHRLQIVHGVKRRNFIDGDRRHAEIVRDKVHGLGREPPFLVLSDRERRHHRRLLLIGRILGELRCRFFPCARR